ncbi:hypothetical protein [Arcobacter vandammei]|uniref:hypothetical protein n=1 Tax=Arcobacter vandammei TaxID=2782243 RepID=UPI0018DFDBD0|nr:hypothetical protein [Arcobacter vandammei]
MRKITILISTICLCSTLFAQNGQTAQTTETITNVDKLDALDRQSKEFFKSITGLEKSYLEDQMQEIKNKKDEAEQKGVRSQNTPQATQNEVIMTEEEYEKNVFNHQNEIARITTDFTRTRKIKDLKIKSMYTFNGKDYAVLLLDDSESSSRNKTSTELSGNIEGRYVEGDNILGLKIIDINTRTKSIELYKKLDEDTGYTIYLSNHGINVSNLEKRDKNDPRYTKTVPKELPKKVEHYVEPAPVYAPVKSVERVEVKKEQPSVKKAFEDVKDTPKSSSNKPCYIVNKKNLNVRDKADESARILRVLKIDDKFIIQQTNGEWLNIDTIYKKVSGDVMDVSTQNNWVQNTDGSLSEANCN